jgi:YegS/Rv2252/BmrU family lipid kinase
VAAKPALQGEGGVTKALVVGRRRKGRGIRGVVREVGAALKDAGWKVDTAVVDHKSEIRHETRRAVTDGCDVVVAVGGDGGVREVASVLVGTQVALGIIPTGTGNLLAGNLGIPTRRDKAVRTLTSGIRRRIDMGVATIDGTEHTFAVACGMGFDADVMKATGNTAKRRWGKLAYFASVFSIGTRIRSVPVEITVDGVTTKMEAAQVMLANFGRMMAGLSPRRPVLADDGLLEVIVVRASGPLDALPAAWEALRQKDLGETSGGRVFRTQGTIVRVVAAEPLLVEVDGNVVGETPVAATILPASLTVIVPAS